MKNIPEISIVTCTYNGERVIEDYFINIFKQDYPLNKVEIIVADGGSTDKTLEIIEKYRKKYPKIVKYFHNKKKYSIGKGAGVDTFSRKAVGKYIILLDQDNLLVQHDWISKMVEILKTDKTIVAVQSRMVVPKEVTNFEKYIGAIGIEDPFAVPYSLNAQIVFNPQKFQYNKERNYFVYKIDRENFFYAGDNGFIMRKEDFFKAGGYTQDIDNFYRMSLLDFKVAIPRDIKLYHKTTTSLMHLLKKRAFYVRVYMMENYKEREFYWFDLKKNSFRRNMKFLLTVFSNLLFVPALIEAFGKYFEDKQSYWFIHPIALFLITLTYINSFIFVKIFKKIGSANI